jgi:hypothetical protein
MNKHLYVATLSFVLMACDSSYHAPESREGETDLGSSASKRSGQGYELHGNTPAIDLAKASAPEVLAESNPEAPVASPSGPTLQESVSQSPDTVPAEGDQTSVPQEVESEVEEASLRRLRIVRVAAYKANSILAQDDVKLTKAASDAQALQLKFGEVGTLGPSAVANFWGGIDSIVVETDKELPRDLSGKNIKAILRNSITGEFVKVITVLRVEKRNSNMALFRFDTRISDAALEFRFVHPELDKEIHYYFANVAGEMGNDTKVVRVSGADLSRLHVHLRQPYAAHADLNRDGNVDEKDLAVVQGRISPTVRCKFLSFKAGSL